MKGDKAIEYELMVKELFSQKIAQEWSIENFVFSHRRRFEGIDSNFYEIDIAFEFKMAGFKLLGIIECKNYSRPVGRNIVAEFITKKAQLNANIGLIVSPYGFQKGAVKLAGNKGIKLAQVCHYSYTPLVGDPTLQDNYYNDLVKYIQEQDKSYSRSDIETYLAKLDICTGNAYRADEITDLKLSEKSIYDFNSSVYFEIGFKLITDDKPVLVDKKDLLLTIYCESLLLAGRKS
jgi:hypothetical protein